MARYVTVASVSHHPSPGDGPDRRGQLLGTACAHVQRAARMGADIVAFPEVYAQLGQAEGWQAWNELAEDPEGGPTIAAMREQAERLGLHIIWPTLTRERGRVYNSAVLIDSRGKVTGVYHKMHPTIGEIENGITPGEEIGVFDTSFGRIGTCICFDLNFPDTMEGLGRGGAEVVFFCSMYRGGLQLRAWAHKLGAYMVSAITGELGMIVDQGGEVLAESTSEIVIARRVNLDSELLHLDYNGEKLDDMLAKYGPDISFRYYSREACWTVSSEREGLSIEDIKREFGLESRAAYFARAEQIRQQALAARSGT